MRNSSNMAGYVQRFCCVGKQLALSLLATAGIVSPGLAQKSTNFKLVKMAAPKEAAKSIPLGRMASGAILHLSLNIGYRDPVGMSQFVNSVSNPKSPNYRHFLSPAQIGERFGPLAGTVEKAKNYLLQHGMTIKLVGKNRLSILADSTVQQAENAFQTEIHEYLATDGYMPKSGHLYSFITPPSLPEDLQPYVVHIGGLETFTHPNLSDAINPNQIQTLYGLGPLFTLGAQGEGRTVGISNFDGFKLSNIMDEYSEFQLPIPSGGVLSNVSVETIDGGSGSGTAKGEGDLDQQAILGVAPLCNLIIYDGADDLINVLTQESDDNKADIISESYGWKMDSSTMLAAHNLHLAMSAQGITYMAASGDTGTSLSYPYPDIDPEVLLVGGTSCTVDGSGNRISETGWSGSGGGWVVTSDPFNILPSYQTGAGVPTGIPFRLIPDVALNADPNTGYVVYVNGVASQIGGTSGASPTFAGSLAVAEEEIAGSGGMGLVSGNRFGRIQDLIYPFNGNSNIFYDVTSGSNGSLPNGNVSNAAEGWDFVTGLGAMNFNGLRLQLAGNAVAGFNVDPNSVLTGGESVTGSVNLASAAGPGGVTVTLSGGDSAVSYPKTLTIPEKATFAKFTIQTHSVPSTDIETLNAVVEGTTLTATLTIVNQPIGRLSFAPATGASGTTFTGTVTMAYPVVNLSGTVVTLSGGDSNVSFPTSVTVAQGSKTANFTVKSVPTPSGDHELITATSGPHNVTSTLVLTPMALGQISVSPTSVMGGGSATGTVTLCTAAGTGGITVTLSGGDSNVAFPTSVLVPAGSKSATFKVTTKAVAKTETSGIWATFQKVNKLANLTVKAPSLSKLSLTPTSVTGGQTSSAVVTLTGPAGPTGFTVKLSGGDSSVTYPASVLVASGQTSASFTVNTLAVKSTHTETLKATSSAGSAAATLTLKH